jgi:adenylate cyclase
MNRGAFDFLTKPIDFEDLEITVNKTLQYVQQLKESLRLRQEKEEAQKEALAQERLARFIRVVFGRYLTDEVVATLLESPEGLKLGGEKRAVCILMSDLRGFTSLSERLTPEQVITILNRYLGAMVDIILKYQGTIVEFIGDAIMVLFGAPIKREDDVQRAVACAVSMQLAMTLINEQNRQEGLPELEMGIGLNMGEVVVGNIGSHKRTKYGVVGSHVNLTARIESCTVGGQILVSEAILKEEGSILRIGEQMEVEAKGFEKPITIYDLRGIGGAHNLFLPEEDDIFFSLGEEVQVRYTVLEGKQSGGTIFAGNLIKLSAKGGEIYSENLVAPLSNLKMRFMRTYSNETPGDVYGKVIEKLTKDRNCFFVRFTFVPPEVEAFLWDLLH